MLKRGRRPTLLGGLLILGMLAVIAAIVQVVALKVDGGPDVAELIASVATPTPTVSPATPTPFPVIQGALPSGPTATASPERTPTPTPNPAPTATVAPKATPTPTATATATPLPTPTPDPTPLEVVIISRSPIIRGQTNTPNYFGPVHLGSDFTLESGSATIGDVRLRMIRYGLDYVVASIFYDEGSDGEFYPRQKGEQVELRDGKCFSAPSFAPGTDYRYCFDTTKNSFTLLIDYWLEENDGTAWAYVTS